MILALMVALLGSAPSGAATAAVLSDDPPIKVWLNQDNYFLRGDKARVNVKLAEDGYLVVLRADAEGRVRVLFPLDPGDDAFVRGGRKIEVRGRGDREAFSIDEREGSGLVLAARSATPFKFDEFVRGDHWDYRVLTAREAGDDKEQALLDIVQRMVADGGPHFDYDAVTYTVASPRAYNGGYYPHYSSIGLRLGYGYGWPYRYGFYYSSCFDPFWYDPFFCGAYYDPFFYGYSPFFYDPFFYRPFIYVSRPFIYGGRGVIYRSRYGGGLFIDRVRPRSGGWLTFKQAAAAPPTVMGVAPRLRIPQGTLLTRTPQGRAVPVSEPALTPVRVRDLWSDGSQRVRARDRAAPGEGGTTEARPVDRGAGGRGWARPAPERRETGRGADRPASSRGREPSSSGGGWSSGGGGGGGGHSSGGSAGSSGGASRSSGSSGHSAPANGGGRRRP